MFPETNSEYRNRLYRGKRDIVIGNAVLVVKETADYFSYQGIKRPFLLAGRVKSEGRPILR
jgi:hypothetical protein